MDNSSWKPPRFAEIGRDWEDMGVFLKKSTLFFASTLERSRDIV